MQGNGAVSTIIGRDQSQFATFFARPEGFLLIARCNALDVRLDPDLQKMRFLALGVVELAMLHPRACAHTLHIARRYALDVAHAVFVRQIALQHIADDFHVFVAVGTEAGAGRNPVFVDDPQVAKTHVLFIVVARK